MAGRFVAHLFKLRLLLQIVSGVGTSKSQMAGIDQRSGRPRGLCDDVVGPLPIAHHVQSQRKTVLAVLGTVVASIGERR